MQMNFSDVDAFKKVALTGRLDSANVGTIEPQFSAAVVAGGKGTMVDLTDVDFLASLGVRMLISTARSLSSRGCKLVMFGANESVAETIDVMGFSDIVPLADSESDAIALLKA